MRESLFLPLALVWGCAKLVMGQETNSAIREEILGVYSFSPHALTSYQISQKSKILDSFWQKAKSQSEVYLPVLKSELVRRDAPAFLLWDGSMLLLTLSDSAENRRVALQAFARCNLLDIQPTEYFIQVHRLAALGEDSTDAAFHILSDPKFKAFIPQHSLTLGQDYALIYMLLPTDPTNWLSRAVTRVGVETDPTAQKSLLLLLWYAQTKEADRAIADFAAAKNNLAASRKYAHGLLSRKGKAGRSASSAKQSEESIRKARRDRMQGVSDEALIDLDELTLQLISTRR